MRETDLNGVMHIELAAYEFPWSEGIFRDCIKAGYALWVLDDGGRIVGYGVLSIAADEAHILNIATLPERRGEGLGRRLLNRLIDLGRWHHVERIFLEVRPSNLIAIGLYQRSGFREIGTRPNYYPAKSGREDAVVMEREMRG